jgi:hypothetical protein
MCDEKEYVKENCNISLKYILIKSKKSLVAGFSVKKEQRLIMKNGVGDRVRNYLTLGRCRTGFILFCPIFLTTNSLTVSFNRLQAKRILLHLKTQSVPSFKHFNLVYKNQSVYAVSGSIAVCLR